MWVRFPQGYVWHEVRTTQPETLCGRVLAGTEDQSPHRPGHGCRECDWIRIRTRLDASQAAPRTVEASRVATTSARPVTICPRCGGPSHADVLCDACEEAEAVLFLANNSLTDSRGVQLGDDPRR